MPRCTGSTVVVESPTIPTYTEESVDVDGDVEYTREAGALTISMPDDVQDPCVCDDTLVAVTYVIYDGQYFYDNIAMYSATLIE